MPTQGKVEKKYTKRKTQNVIQNEESMPIFCRKKRSDFSRAAFLNQRGVTHCWALRGCLVGREGSFKNVFHRF